jgi:hypothetical protein
MDGLLQPHAKTNEREAVCIFCRVTAAADVAANGYTVLSTIGGDKVASVARSAEGIAVITLRDKYAAFLGLDYDISRDNVLITKDAETVATTKLITVTFRTTAGADADPDSAVINLRIWLKNAVD